MTTGARLAGEPCSQNLPVFTLSAILTLAVCIGANVAVFSTVDRLLLRPLP